MKFKNYIETESGIKDTSTSPGTAGQVLSSTVTGTSWIDQSEIVAAAATVVAIACKNTHTTALTKGTPVYQTGTVGATDVIEIAPGNALISSGAQPSIGLLQQDLDINEFGFVIITGELLNITTDPIDGLTPTTGQKVFVKPGGGLTLTKPTTELNSIQNMGLIGKVSSGNAGSITVSSIMRTNDVPNLTTGKIWVGDGNTVESTVVHLDETNGRMGIGETNPDTILHITGNEPTIKLEDNVGADFFNPKIEFFSSSEGGTLEYISNPNFSGMRLHNKSSFPTADTFLNLKYGLGEFQSVGITGGTTLKTDGVLQVTGSNDSYFSNGNVGIGTTSPQGLLHISSDSTPTLIIGTKTANQANSGAISFREIESTSEIELRYNGADNAFKIWTSLAGDALTVLRSNGNVGIGNPNPSYLLDVNEDDDILAFRVTGGGGGNPIASFVRDVGSTGASVNIGASSNFPQIQFVSTGNTFAIGADSSGNFKISDNSTIGTNDRITIDNIGNVGINDTDPDAILTVFRTSTTFATALTTAESRAGLSVKSTSTYDAKLTISTGTSGVQQIQGVNNAATTGRDIAINPYGGNVGIGTTTPGAKLTVVDDILLTGSSPSLTLTDATSSFVVATNTAGEGIIKTSADKNIRFFRNDSTETMRIAAATGNVGIGTTSPQGILHVNSTAATASYFQGLNSTLRILNNTSNDNWLQSGTSTATSQAVLYVSGMNGSNITTTFDIPNQRVGIGTTSPGAKLHVSGSQDFVLIESTANSDATYRSKTTLGYYGSGTGIGSATNCWNVYDFNAGSERMRIASTGNVGIGTTSPGQKLSVAPSTNVSGEFGYAHVGNVGHSGYAGFSHVNLNSAGNYALLQHSTGVTYLNASSGQSIRFRINNSDKMLLDSIGRVGIGTTSPNQRLTINGTDQYVATEQTNYVWGGTTTLGVRMGTDATAGLLDFRRWTGTGTTHGTALITQVNSDGGYGLDFRVNTQSTNTTATTSRMFLSTSGEVGIGTTGPVQKLDVAGSVRVQDRLYTNANATNSVGILGKATVNGWASRYDSNNANFSGFYFDGNHHSIIAGRNAAGTITNWIHASGSSYFNGGNVGIGTTNPGKLLELSGGENVAAIRLRDTTSNTWDIQNSTFGKLDFIRGGTNTYMRIDQFGNVGIGTTSPGKKLHVSSNDQSTARIRLSNTNTASGGDDIELVAGVNNLTQDGFSIYNATSAQTQLVIQGGGNVGIGVTSPAAKLDISDTADEVDLTSTTNFAINTGGLIASRHYKNVNLETPEFEWSIGGSTDLNWKKLATIVVSDANYSGFGAEVEITDFSGNFGNSVAEYGDVYRGGLSIYHQGGAGFAPKEGIITIHNDMIPHIRIYKIAGSGNSSYEIQVKSPADFRQMYIKLKAGIGNQIADIFSHANNTNGSTSGGTAYTPDAYTSGNQFKTGFTTVTANRGNILYRFGIGTTSPAYPLDVNGDARITTDNQLILSRSTSGGATSDSCIYVDNTFSGFGNPYNIDSDLSSYFGSRHIGFRYNGTIVGSIAASGTTAVTYNTTSSDERLKKNIEDWQDNILDKFEQIEPKKFNFITEADGTDKTKGFIAQNMIADFPEAYPHDYSENQYHSFNPSGMVVYLMKAVKELIQKNKELETRIQILENQ